jgi:Ion channel
MLLAAIVGVVLIFMVLLDAFETIVLPRRVVRRLRLAVLVLRPLWLLWCRPARRWRSSDRRETYLSFFGPLGLILLIVMWAAGLIMGFALLLWGLGAQMATSAGGADFGTALYGSGTTFFTLGLGDVLPHTALGRVLVVLEGGMGFAFLALIISYLPVLYQAFSRREVNVSLLDARAGSPPSAGELLRRHAGADFETTLGQLLTEWERWAAELMESHLSYPLLAFYRSQHERQSWIAALTTILDVSTLVIVGIDDAPQRPARLAFAMARHAAADLSQTLGTAPSYRGYNRLPPTDLAELRAMLREAGISLREGREADEKLAHLRRMYEPYVSALADRLLMPLPHWLPTVGARDAWQITAWGTEQWDVAREGGDGRD